MKTYVSPNSACRSLSRLRICACTDTSSADTGSSQTIRRGLAASARATPIRCRCPPENSCGKPVVVLGVQADDLEQLLDAALALRLACRCRAPRAARRR